MVSASVVSSSSTELLLYVPRRILCRMNFGPIPDGELSIPSHAGREANRMGDMDSVDGVGRIGVSGIERDGDEGDELEGRDEGDNNKGRGEGRVTGDDDNGRDEGDDNKCKDESNGVRGDCEAGDLGRGRIRRVPCVEGAVCARGSAIGGTAGKGRRLGGVTFFIDDAPVNVLLSI